ncbi:glycerol-3-phosphate 1-O-acyltransferase PlsY [Clostridium fallax]|uniref:Glycerol-3-phosphate acyltransferase n=1 Tax=Clostridium fallax TaxID=1533 RepID=A0A1M4Z5J3_9CLOT|nr:glycerol-3-phosphate 1-O-acyltransferase PlsY [Clostridium fallax]SHF13012.1 glycerol-3-phosphate acyltransferase PlsY [Clostridium fallax]SQB05898.1 membrane protein [Clostridium fallax]
MNNLIIIITIIVSFLLGSIPVGYIISNKLYGIDITKKGSGNIGSTNVGRILGKKASIYTQIADISKGLIPVILGLLIFNFINISISKDLFLSIIALAAILGHDYTPFLNFNGGKGVNTTLGAFALIATIPVIIAVAMHFLLRLITPIVSIRSIVLGLTIPIVCAFMNFPISIIVSASLAAILIVIRHKSNIIKLINKEEN